MVVYKSSITTPYSASGSKHYNRRKRKKKEKNNIDYSNGVEKRDGFKDRYQERLYIVERL